MGKIGPRTNSRAVIELYCVTLAPYVQVFKYFLCFCISHTLRGTLVDVTIACFFFVVVQSWEVSVPSQYAK